MATMFLWVRDGKFTFVRGEYDEMTADRAVGNGWLCTINQKGVIHCVAERKYEDGVYKMSYMLRPDGFARLSLRRPTDEMPKNIKRGFVVDKGARVEGVICLNDAPHIANYHAFFRTKSFQTFLDEMNIRAVKHENPNKEYSLTPGIMWEVFSDGNVEFDMLDNSKRMVSGATWVILRKAKIEYGRWKEVNILYTLQNPREIKFPPEIAERICE